MKNKGGKLFMVNGGSDFSKYVKMVICDDGDWEYDRLGVGVYKGKVFLMDLNDDGEEYKCLVFVKEGLSVEDVLRIGVECNVLSKGENGRYYVIWDNDGNDSVYGEYGKKLGVDWNNSFVMYSEV